MRQEWEQKWKGRQLQLKTIDGFLGLDIVDQLRIAEAIAPASHAIWVKLKQVTVGLKSKVLFIRKKTLAQTKIMYRGCDGIDLSWINGTIEGHLGYSLIASSQTRDSGLGDGPPLRWH